MNRAREALHRGILIGGSAALVALAILRLPPGPDLLKAPATLFDRCEDQSVPATFRLLSRVSSLLPSGSSVTVWSQPRDPVAETSLDWEAIALLPGRRIFPSARWYTASPEIEFQADYVIVVGPKPSRPPGSLLLETPDGTLWRRERS